MIADPLTKLHCCIRSDGGGAIVLTSEERAKDLRRPPVWVLGSGETSSHTTMSEWEDFTEAPAIRSGKLAFERAGITPADVDTCQIYDAFTSMVLLSLEALGFCGRGEGGAFVEDGKLRVGGALPTNTDGGGLSACHPGMRGMFLMVEAVKQLRGEAGARQVPDARHRVRQRNRRLVLVGRDAPPRHRLTHLAGPSRRSTDAGSGQRGGAEEAAVDEPGERVQHLVVVEAEITGREGVAEPLDERHERGDRGRGVGRLVRTALVHPPAEHARDVGERAHSEPVHLTVADLVFHPRPDHDAVAAVRRDETLEEGAELREPLVGGVDRPDLLGQRVHLLRTVDRQRPEQVFLVGEVEIEGAVRGPGGAHDVVHPALVVAAFGEHPHAGVREPAHGLAALSPQLALARRCPGGGALRPRAELCDPEPMLPQTMREAARQFGDATAYVTEDGRALSFNDLDRSRTKSRPGCSRRGVRAGDVVALVLPPGPEYLLAYLGAAKLGAITTGVNDRLSRPERDDVLDARRARGS